jgi:arylsulfate sulfotransferase
VRQLKVWVIILASTAALAGPASSQTNCKVPGASVTLAPNQHADTGQGIVLTTFFNRPGIKGCIGATDMKGTPTWSYCSSKHMFMTRWVPGGTVLMLTNDNFTNYQVDEIDLTGALLHAYTVDTANTQLAAMNKQPIIDFDHEAIRLPNGYTAAIAHNERLETNVQGPGTVDVMGDEILVLDNNWNLVWSWNAFDWLPVSRAAILGERCKACAQSATGGCCPVTLASTANDWLHSNSLAYDSSDGNLIMSVRSQDWVIKIAYQNGAGDGHLVWTLGNQGSFTMLNTPNIPSPWFSHQHDAEIQAMANPKLIMLFDNGNTRRSLDATAKSRGQVLSINETNMTADIVINVDFTFYANGYGTAQLLDNGNYWWQAGAANGQNAAFPTRSTEYVKSGVSGNPAYSIEFADTSYRSFRLTSLTGTGF